MTTLERVREEIEQLTSRYSISKERGGMGQVEWSDRLIKESDVFRIIDKYAEQKPIDYQQGYIDGVNQMVKELKAEQEPCEDAISRQAVLDLIEHYNSDGLGSVFYDFQEGVKFAGAVNKLPSVIPKFETVTEFADRCRECGAKYGKLLNAKTEYFGNWLNKEFRKEDKSEEV